MICFYHNDREAVVQCANCGKNLCNECATQIDLQCYCPDCANAIQQYNSQVQQQVQQDTQAFTSKWKRRYLIEIIATIIMIVPAIGFADALTDGKGFWYYLVFLMILGIPGTIFGLIVGRAKTPEERILKEVEWMRFDDMGCLGMIVYIVLDFVIGNIFTLICIINFIKLSVQSKKQN